MSPTHHSISFSLILSLILPQIHGQFNFGQLGQLGQQFGLGNLGGALGGLLGGGGRQQQQQWPSPGPQRHPNMDGGGPPPWQGGGGGPPPMGGNRNPMGGLGNVGGSVENLLNRIGLNQQFTHQLGGLINGVASNFVCF
jgi:hypothetical protein